MAHIQRRTYKSKRTGKNATSWQARYTAPDGRERTKRFERRVDAERWLDANVADVTRGVWVDPDAGRIALSVYANDWLESRTDLRPSTRGKYRGLLDRNLIPAFGAIPIAQISPASVRKWHSDLHRRHPSTAASAYRLLSTICRSAVNDEVLARSPCRVKGAAAEHASERPTATMAELQAAFSATPLKYQAALLLAAWCQLRRGEVLGLQRQDIDVDNGLISIRRAWIQLPGGEHLIGPRRRVRVVERLPFPRTSSRTSKSICSGWAPDQTTGCFLESTAFQSAPAPSATCGQRRGRQSVAPIFVSTTFATPD